MRAPWNRGIYLRRYRRRSLARWLRETINAEWFVTEEGLMWCLVLLVVAGFVGVLFRAAWRLG